jgi:hypothetical protein
MCVEFLNTPTSHKPSPFQSPLTALSLPGPNLFSGFLQCIERIFGGTEEGHFIELSFIQEYLSRNTGIWAVNSKVNAIDLSRIDDRASYSHSMGVSLPALTGPVLGCK